MLTLSSRPYYVVAILLIIQVLGAFDAVLSRYALVLGVDPFVFISIRIALCLPPFLIGSFLTTHRKSLNSESSDLLDHESFGSTLQEVDETTAYNRSFKPTFKQNLLFVALGFIGVTVFLPLRYYGNLLENASTTGFTNAFVPIVTFIVTLALHHEVITWKKTVGVVISFSGAILMFYPFDFLSFTLGLFLLFFSSICFGIFLSFQKPLLDVFPPVYVLARIFGYGSIGIFLVAISRYQKFYTLFDLSSGFGGEAIWAWGAIVYSAWFNTVLGYLLYGYAIHLASPLLVGLFVNIQPILISILAVFFLQEMVSFWRGVGAFLIMLGVMIVTLARYYHPVHLNQSDSDLLYQRRPEFAKTHSAYHYTSPLTIDNIELDTEDNSSNKIKSWCRALFCAPSPVISPPLHSASWHHSPTTPLGRLSARNYLA